MRLNSYGNLSTQFYDLDKPHPPQEAFQFYLQHAHSASSPILEPMCGSGRFLVPLMAHGFSVTGVDASPAMLAACRRRAADAGLMPNLYEQFLQALDLPVKFQMVMIPTGSFCLITDLEVAVTSLERIYDHLLPGGRLFLEIEQYIGADEMKQEDDTSTEPTVTRPDGSLIRIQSSGSHNPSKTLYQGINRYDLIRNGQIHETEWEQFNLRYYTPGSFEALLRSTGFTNIVYHSAYDPSLPLERSESLVFMAVRPSF
jgi:SAM-dependent methyltransferase